MRPISADLIQAYRDRTFRSIPERRIGTREQAIDFVNERGFIHFWPITGVLLPSLWVAVAGDRPVADEHDDPGHITWDWKDSLLGSDRWYYAKVLRKKATMISFEIVPYFYALSENYGSPKDDYLTIYEQGRMTLEEKTIYEALIDEGSLDTITLRRATHMSSPTSESRFNRALTNLQADFRVLPVGVTQAGAWKYAFAYDIVAHHYPEILDKAHHICEGEARRVLAEIYLRTIGVGKIQDVARLFNWRITDTEIAIDALIREGMLTNKIILENQTGDWIAHRTLIQ
jgi:hypothetical protein